MICLIYSEAILNFETILMFTIDQISDMMLFLDLHMINQ